MTKNKLFVDSNVWVYANVEDGDPRSSLAQDFIEAAPLYVELVISYQVVNESICVLKKNGKRETELLEIIAGMFDICKVSGFTQSGAKLASELREALSISYWDSHIAASAILEGCDMLISEDFQDNLLIRNLRVRNPFIVP